MHTQAGWRTLDNRECLFVEGGFEIPQHVLRKIGDGEIPNDGESILMALEGEFESLNRQMQAKAIEQIQAALLAKKLQRQGG